MRSVYWVLMYERGEDKGSPSESQRGMVIRKTD